MKTTLGSQAVKRVIILSVISRGHLGVRTGTLMDPNEEQDVTQKVEACNT